MLGDPVIAVVIPVYNKVSFLRASLDSVQAAARAHGRVEMVLVDNGSTDGSLEIARGYTPFATLAQLPSATIAAVRNQGARLSHAPILSFLDCDCVVAPDYFRMLEEILADPGLD